MGVLLLGFGIFVVLHPVVMHVYDIALDKPTARTGIRAIIGGGEIALGLILIFGRRLGASAFTLNAMAALVFGCVGAVRLSSAAYEGILALGTQPLREGMIELVLCAFCVIAMRASRLIAVPS